MQDAHAFLTSLTVVLAVAAVTTVVFQRLRQPVVLGYIIAGLIVGPHVPIPLVADPNVVQTLSELGVILLMFSLGLEFSLRKLMAVGPTAGLTALLQSSLMVWLGSTIGRLFGWTPLESLFAGVVIAISSTTIIAKAFDEQGITGTLREFVVGVLIVEDLIAVLLMAVLTAIASGTGLAAGPLVATVARLVAFLVTLVAVGLMVVPRAIRAIVRLNRRETTLVASIGICFTIALLAQAFGYSTALGFGAVFFVSGGRLVVTFQLAGVLLVGLPLLALTQPFLPGPSGPLVLALVMVVLGVAFWRSATNLQGHVRAGAQVILEALAAQSRPRATPSGHTLEQVHQLLPGLGALAAVRLEPGSAAVG